MKNVIWFCGSMGSGKTTQCKKLIDFLTEGETPKSVIEDKIYYTHYEDSGVIALGKIAANQCTGLDSVYSSLGADGVLKTLKAALLTDANFIIVDCAFATQSWMRKWVEAGIRPDFKMFVFHLELDLWENFKRISERQSKRAKEKGENKEWWEMHLADTVYKNVGSKNRETRNIFRKFEGTHEKSEAKLTADHCKQIKATLPPEVIHRSLVKFITKNI